MLEYKGFHFQFSDIEIQVKQTEGKRLINFLFYKKLIIKNEKKLNFTVEKLIKLKLLFIVAAIFEI